MVPLAEHFHAELANAIVWIELTSDRVSWQGNAAVSVEVEGQEPVGRQQDELQALLGEVKQRSDEVKDLKEKGKQLMELCRGDREVVEGQLKKITGSLTQLSQGKLTRMRT